MYMPTATCEVCGTQYRRSTQGPKPKVKTCSDKCRNRVHYLRYRTEANAEEARQRSAAHAARKSEANRLTKAGRPCRVCGQEIPTEFKVNRRTCTAECKTELNRREGRAKRAAFITEHGFTPESRYKASRNSTAVTRKHRERAAVSEDFTREEIFERDGWICQLCHEPVDPGLGGRTARAASIDHIVPISRGGSHTRSNVQLAHLGCNSSKHAR